MSDLAHPLSFGFITRALSLVMCLGALLSGAVLCYSQTPAPGAGDKVPLNVRDFGAVGDGKVKDTGAIQKALDACARGGGGACILGCGEWKEFFWPAQGEGKSRESASKAAPARKPAM